MAKWKLQYTVLSIVSERTRCEVYLGDNDRNSRPCDGRSGISGSDFYCSTKNDADSTNDLATLGIEGYEGTACTEADDY